MAPASRAAPPPYHAENLTRQHGRVRSSAPGLPVLSLVLQAAIVTGPTAGNSAALCVAMPFRTAPTRDSHGREAGPRQGIVFFPERSAEWGGAFPREFLRCGKLKIQLTAVHTPYFFAKKNMKLDLGFEDVWSLPPSPGKQFCKVLMENTRERFSAYSTLKKLLVSHL